MRRFILAASVVLITGLAGLFAQTETQNVVLVRGQVKVDGAWKPWTFEMPFGPDQFSGFKDKLTYISRGDLADWEYTKSPDLTIDDAWHDLVLTNEIPTGASLAVLRVWVTVDSERMEGRFRKKGNTGLVNWDPVQPVYTNFNHRFRIDVLMDTNSTIQYKFSTNGTWNTIKIAVQGYFTSN